MKTIFLAIIFAVSSISASALANTLPLSLRDVPGIEKSIEQVVTKDANIGELKQFSIKWDQTVCMNVEPSELSEQSGGTCIVTATAFQVYAKVGVIIGQSRPVVSVIYVDVE